jgi:DHA3 family macrolide efflux protein-like MFS transporter
MERPKRLMNRNFFLLWQGQLVSQLGLQAFSIAMVFWIKHVTGSATLMGLLLMLSNLPAVILSPLAGTFADRHSRRTIIIFCDTLNGLAVLSLAAWMFLAPNEPGILLIWLFAVAITVAVVSTFFRPAISAAIPDLVPTDKVAAANSFNQASVQISTFLGQGLGGVLYRILGAPALFLINGLTYLFSALSEVFITIPQVIPQKSDHWRQKLRDVKQDTIEGFHYVWGKAGMRNFFFAVAILNFLFVPTIVLFPFYVEDVLKTSVDWYGFLLAAFGVGALGGYLLAGALKLPGRIRSVAVMLMIVGTAIIGILLGVNRSPTAALLLMLAVGIMSGFININIITILQLSTPSEIRGRVFGLLSTLSAGLIPVSMGLTGVVADLLNQNVPLILISTGSLGTLFSALLLTSEEFREFLAYEPAKEISPQAPRLGEVLEEPK